MVQGCDGDFCLRLSGEPPQRLEARKMLRLRLRLSGEVKVKLGLNLNRFQASASNLNPPWLANFLLEKLHEYNYKVQSIMLGLR